MASSYRKDTRNSKKNYRYADGADDDEFVEDRETFAAEAKLKKKQKSSKKAITNENQYDKITNPEFVSPRSDSNRISTIEKSLTYLQAQ